MDQRSQPWAESTAAQGECARVPVPWRNLCGVRASSSAGEGMRSKGCGCVRVRCGGCVQRQWWHRSTAVEEGTDEVRRWTTGGGGGGDKHARRLRTDANDAPHQRQSNSQPALRACPAPPLFCVPLRRAGCDVERSVAARSPRGQRRRFRPQAACVDEWRREEGERGRVASDHPSTTVPARPLFPLRPPSTFFPRSSAARHPRPSGCCGEANVSIFQSGGSSPPRATKNQTTNEQTDARRARAVTENRYKKAQTNTVKLHISFILSVTLISLLYLPIELWILFCLKVDVKCNSMKLSSRTTGLIYCL